MRILTCLILLSAMPVLAQPGRLLNARNDQAIQETMAGKRTVANAAWWGYDIEDATQALQAAIDSGVKTLVVPYMGTPWVVRPLKLRSNLELVFEPGVLILAKKGEFQGGGDSLFSAINQSNIVIRGYGATLRMHKRDYQNPPYKKAEWRMGIALRGCRKVLIEGVRVESTGGDGIYVDGAGDLEWSEDITIRNSTAHDNHRQGISVISAVNLLIENCVFSNTWGTAPEAGIDFEPDSEKQRLVNCVVRNSVFENNNGNQILIYLKPLSRKSAPVSIRFENCLARMTDARLTPLEPGPKTGIQGVAGIAIGAIRDDGPQGLIEFRNCVSDNTGKENLRVFDKSAGSARVRFVNCSFRRPWNTSVSDDGIPRVPVFIQLRKAENTNNVGGIDFEDCYVYDSVYRPAIRYEQDKSDFGLRDVHGQILVSNPAGVWMRLGSKLENVDLKVIEAGK